VRGCAGYSRGAYGEGIAWIMIAGQRHRARAVVCGGWSGPGDHRAAPDAVGALGDVGWTTADHRRIVVADGHREGASRAVGAVRGGASYGCGAYGEGITRIMIAGQGHRPR